MGQTDTAPRGRDLTLGAPLAEIPEGGMLAGHVGEETVLLSRSGGQVFAVSGSCTHYGGALADGLAGGGKVACPLHHACFDLRTGEALGAPAFAPLQAWRAQVEGGTVFVRERMDAPAPVRQAPGGAPEKIVIVGGGAAGFAAADQLRRLGFAGGLTMISADADAPYDRPNLSKDYLAGEAPPEWMPLKDDDYYAQNRIALRLGDEVAAIDRAGRRVTLTSGEAVDYDALLLATGAEPIRLDTPGFDHPKVRTLRSMADAAAIIALAGTAKRAVVIGASFIGLETAAALRQRGLEVHVVAPEALPMERILGRELAILVTELHRAQGVVFHLERKGTVFDGARLALDDGTSLEADLMVVGVGVRPRTGLAAQAGLAVENGIAVDAMLRTADPAVFAAGDVARYPDPTTGEPVRVEHWVAAERQGQAAAGNMLGAARPFADVPFFWSNHYDLAIRYVGRGVGWDRAEVDGDLAARDGVVRYYVKDRLIAAATVGRDFEALQIAEALAQAGAGSGA